jgi:ribosomal protein S12 methylthiotransferase accessory factor
VIREGAVVMAPIRLCSADLLLTTEQGVVCHGAVGAPVLVGRDIRLLVEQVTPLLDGTRDRGEVLDAVPEELRPAVRDLLQFLERQGLVEPVPDVAEDPLRARWRSQERFFRTWSDRPEEAVRRLKDARVLIVGLEPWGATVAGELAEAGVGALHLLDDGRVSVADLTAARLWHADMLGSLRGPALAERLRTTAPWCRVTVGFSTPIEDGPAARGPWDVVIGALAADDLDRHLALARFAHDGGLRSLCGTLQSFEAVVGPLVIPGETACWNCCRLRLLANADDPQAAFALQGALLRGPSVPRPGTALAPMASLVGQLLALETLKLLSGYTASRLPGRLLIQNLVTLETTFHRVVPMPWCAVCGGAAAIGADRRPSRRPLATDTPEELRDALDGWVDRRTGVISCLVPRANDAGTPRLPVCVTALLGAYADDAAEPEEFADAGGKGLTMPEAMLGAVGEALERYSAARVRLRDLRHAPVRALEDDALDPRRLCLYEAAQYDRSGFPFVPFAADQPHWWARGHWLDNDAPVWVPARPTYYSIAVEDDAPYCQVTSNGLAAGANLEDAALRAVFEAVERDAFMLTWLGRLPGRRLRVVDVLDADVRPVVEELRACGARLELYLLDVGLTIPAVACLGLGDGRRWPGVTVSSAAHLSPRMAVRRAILEQGYSGPSLRRVVQRGARSIPERPEQVRTFLDHALFYAPPSRRAAFDFLRSDGGAPLALAALGEPDEVSLRACAERLAAGGVRVALADVTAPDVARGPFRVVRALGTDLQPIHCGHGLARLANPRLRALLTGAVNPDPHPLC